MKDNYHFVAISGSLRKESYNTKVLKVAQKIAPKHIVIEHLSIEDIPMYNFDLFQSVRPQQIEKLSESIKKADALIIFTPEYNYSIPGVLKNAIDFLSKHPDKPFNKKTVGIISASPGLLGGVRAQYHLRQILVAVNAMTLNIPEVMITEVDKKIDKDGNLTDEKTTAFIKRFIESLAEFSSNFKPSIST